jgi:hypothetical protein
MAITLGLALALFWLLMVLVLVIQRLRQTQAILAIAVEDLHTARTREIDTNQKMEKVLVSLSPLLEQTDWMTGRWGGQFSTLVSMEKARNSKAVAIRTHLMSLPFIKEYVSENSMGLFTGSTSTALKVMIK